MSILIFGSSGQVATELGRYAPDATFLDRAACDLSDPGSTYKFIYQHIAS